MIISSGIILSIGVISSVFVYVDTSSNQLVSRSMDDLPVDLSINFANRSSSLENITQILDSINSMSESKILEAKDPIIGGGPFEPSEQIGFALAKNSNFTLSPIQENANPDYIPTFGFGLTREYLNRRNSPFTVVETVSEQLEANQVWISQSTAIEYDFQIGDLVNVSIGAGFLGVNLTMPIGNSLELVVAGFVDIDLGLFLENIDAYIPELQIDDEFLSLITFQSFSADMVFIDWEVMLGLTSNQTFSRAVHAIHLSLDSENLGANIDDIEINLLSLETNLAVQFPDLIISNFALEHLETVSEKIKEFRLFMLYFSLPGIFLGMLLTNFVIKITADERYKEIQILQLRNARNKTIMTIIALEVLFIAFFGSVVGFVLGLIVGSLLLSSIETSIEFGDFSGLLTNLSQDSIQTSIAFSILLSTILTITVVRKFSGINYTELQTVLYTTSDGIIEKYKIDYIMFVFIAFIYLINQYDFNPIPSFAQALYELFIPFFIWIALALLVIRLLLSFLGSVEPVIIRFLPKLSSATWIAIFKSMIRNRKKLSPPILIIVLTLSIALSLNSLSTTFTNQVELESKFAIGADMRIQLPGSDQLSFNTSELHQQIEEIDGLDVTDAFITIFSFAGQPSLILAIDPGEFLDFSYFQDEFFFYNSPKDTLTTLSNMPGGLGWIISFDLGFPFADGVDDLSKGPPIFDQNDTIPFRYNFENYEITILDVAIQFPAIGDMTGRPSDELPFLLVDRRFLIDPLPNQDTAIIPQIANSTHFFVNVDESIISLEEAENEILRIYEGFDSPYFLDFRTTEDYKEEFYELGDLFIGLSSVEQIISLILITITLVLYTVSEIRSRTLEFAILHGMGWSQSMVSNFTSLKIIVVTFASILLAIPIGIVTFYAYLPLVEGLFVFNIVNPVISVNIFIATAGLLIISGSISILLNYFLISRSNIAENLRKS